MKHSFKSFYTVGFFLTAFYAVGAVQAATTVIPKISKTSISPSSATTGSMFKFTATLNSATLPSGYTVKVDFGNGLATMAADSSGLNYTLSRILSTVGTGAFKIGVYNSRNILQDVTYGGTYTVKAAPVNHPPEISLVSGGATIENGMVYTLQVKATDSDNNLSNVVVDWKDGSKTERQNATNGTTLTFTHTYTTAGIVTLTAIAKDSGNPILSSTVLSKTVEVTSTPPHYTKVCNSGALEGEEDCPVNPIFGSASTDWGCTKDNKTGLIWEVKTVDGGLRDMNNVYTNYSPSYNPRGEYEAVTDASGFVFDVNSESLCSAKDWRLPTNEELKSLVYCSDGKSKTLGATESGTICTGTPSTPMIDELYFPNTQYLFWSSSPYAANNFNIWVTDFDNSSTGTSNMGSANAVRLVRNGQ